MSPRHRACPPAAASRKLDFNSFTCGAGIALAPRQAIDVPVTVRMLATPLTDTEHCVGLAAKDADPVSANDRHCAKTLIGKLEAQPECPAGQAVADGQCRQLAKLCTDGRGWNEVSQTCTCPADRPVFARAARACAVRIAAVQCTGGRADIGGGCYSRKTPVWDTAASLCRAAAPPEPAVVATAIPKPKPVALQKPKFELVEVAKAKKVVAAKRMKHQAKAVVRRKAARVAAASPPKCPPLWRLTRRGYCYPALLIDPSDIFGSFPALRNQSSLSASAFNLASPFS